MKYKTLHMIGNAHIDPVWLWCWDEGMHAVHATFRCVLDLMNEYDDFIFTASSAAFYAWIEENDPTMFDEIKLRVAQGHWEIVGGWWIEPDCNIPCGESFVRQALYGQRFFKNKFGVTATVGYNPDSFGHNATLPQILKKSGMDYYVFMRPNPNEKDLPGRLFWWESNDGSRVLAYRIPHSYETWGQELEAHVRRFAGEFADGRNELMCFYGVGNHGGGPTRENLESIRRLNASPRFPRLASSSPHRFFTSVAKNDLPVVRDELQHHARGCYAAHSLVKQLNRRSENALLTAEKLSTLAHWLTGLPYPTELTDAWKTVLFNQFHDILAGTCIKPAYEDVRDAYGQAIWTANRAIHRAAQSIARSIRILPEDGMTPLVIFNPHAWQTKACVEFEIKAAHDILILDDNGNTIPTQRIQSQAIVEWRRRFCFIADLPALGYRVYRVLPSRDTAPNVDSSPLQFENEQWHIELDAATGYVKSLRDKTVGVQVFAGAAARPVVFDDPSDTWGHNVERFDHVVGEFAAKRITLVEDGAVRSTLRVESVYGDSRLTQDFTMYRASKQIDVHVTVDWHEQFKLLKLRFPVNVDAAQATYEIPYGHIQRATNGEEEPCQSWVDLSGTSRDSGQTYGLSILNDAKYSFDVMNNVIGLTVLRSPIYAHHQPAMPDPKRQYSFLDQGLQLFTYSMLSHAGDWQQAGTVKRAAELNQRPIMVIETYHPDGPLPQQDSFVSVDQDNVIISAVKRAEDGDDLILRCCETAHKATRSTIRLPKWSRVIQTNFRPSEIKTLRIPRDTSRPIIETNLLEE